MPHTPDQDPLLEVSRELRRYMALLDRCGLDWVVPGQQVALSVAPVAPRQPRVAPAPIVVDRNESTAAEVAVDVEEERASPEPPVVAEPTPAAVAAAESEDDPDESDDDAPAPPAAEQEQDTEPLRAGVGNDYVEELPPPPAPPEATPTNSGDGSPDDDEPVDDPDQIDMFAVGLSLGATPGGDAPPPASTTPTSAPSASPPSASASPAPSSAESADTTKPMPRSAKPNAKKSAAPAQPATPTPPATPAEPDPPRESLEEIAAEIAACTACPLAPTRTNTVPGEGSPTARLMFIGEGPGANEDQQGRPFVGRAGGLLDKMIVAMGLSREEVFIANAVKCRPPDNRNPTTEECAACEHFLQRQIAAIQPEALCLLGRVASQLILRTNKSMKALRGNWYEFEGIPVAVTYHPAYLLRSPGEKAKAWADLQMVMARLGLEPPAKK